MCCKRLAGNTGRKNDAKKSPSEHHRTNLSGYFFATKACIVNRKKNLLSSNISSRCLYNMVNFCPVTAEIDWRAWGTPSYFNGIMSWQRYCTAVSSGRQPNIAALNRGRHLCSTGPPSRWALAHILVWYFVSYSLFILLHLNSACTFDI